MKVLIILIFFMFLFNANVSFALKNPAAAYCTQLGYNYNVVKTSQGEHGECTLPDNSKCDEWQFLEGLCGNSYSYCIKNGYNIKSMSDGKNSYSSDYAVCVPKISGQKERNVTDFITIESDITSSTITESNEIKASSPATSDVIASTTSLPASFDWRDNRGNWMTPVKDQGPCGSCWDFATVGAVEARIKIEKNTPNNNPDLSEQDVLSCSGAGSCTGGDPASALLYFERTGVVDESCFPYTVSDDPCSNKCSDWKNRITKIVGYDAVQTASDIKSHLIQNGPLVTNIILSGYFDSKGIYKCDSIDSSKSHEIVLVGYSDAGGYWIAKNSWGDTWGPDRNGYFKIYYDTCSISPKYYVYATGQINGCNLGNACDGLIPNTGCCYGCYFADITGPTQWVPDGKVDIRDVHLVAKLYGCNVSNACYDARADINGDGKIDIKDGNIVAKAYGMTCTSSASSTTMPSYTLPYVDGMFISETMSILAFALVAIELIVVMEIVRKLKHTKKHSKK